MTTTWHKHSYVCPSCDSAIECTTISAHIEPARCTNCSEELILLSVVDATIYPTTTKEDNMETTTPQVITLDWIENDVVTNKTYTESDIRHMVWQNKTLLNKQNEWFKKESELRTFIHDNFENSDDQESLTAIAEMFDIPLTKEIEVTIWVRVDATVEVELAGGDSFDAVEQFVQDNLTIDSYGSEMSINNYDIDRVEEGAY
jgi:DNA-directed RNA polymerase subunit RPC12/RpoP